MQPCKIIVATVVAAAFAAQQSELLRFLAIAKKDFKFFIVIRI